MHGVTPHNVLVLMRDAYLGVRIISWHGSQQAGCVEWTEPCYVRVGPTTVFRVWNGAKVLQVHRSHLMNRPEWIKTKNRALREMGLTA